MADFTVAVATPESAPYRVLRRYRGAHVVHDRQTASTGYGVFEPQEAVLPEASGVPAADAVLAVDRPSLVITRASDDGPALSVTDPDPRLYEGRDPDQYDADGTFVGRVTSYSRPRRRDPSAPSTAHVTLAGSGTSRALTSGSPRPRRMTAPSWR